MKTIKITCDSCNRDLTFTSNSVDYCLHLADKRIESYDGAVTDMMIFPSLKREGYHFCGVGCLKKWVNDENK